MITHFMSFGKGGTGFSPLKIPNGPGRRQAGFLENQKKKAKTSCYLSPNVL